MPFIEWRKEFETGFPEIDKDHKNLIGAINALVYNLGDNPPKALVREALDDICDMISSHFMREERIMQEHHYDQYADHKADHEFLLDEIRGIINSVEAGPPFVQGQTLVRRLSRWFTEHFQTRDVRLHRMLE